jgi:hypothetical protein
MLVRVVQRAVVFLGHRNTWNEEERKVEAFPYTWKIPAGFRTTGVNAPLVMSTLSAISRQ